LTYVGIGVTINSYFFKEFNAQLPRTVCCLSGISFRKPRFETDLSNQKQEILVRDETLKVVVLDRGDPFLDDRIACDFNRTFEQVYQHFSNIKEGSFFL
jgi:hypothetical protein